MCAANRDAVQREQALTGSLGVINGRQGRFGGWRSAGRSSFAGRAVVACLAAASAAFGLCACDGPPPPGEPVPVSDVFGGLGDMPGRFGYPRALDVSPRGIGVAPATGLLWIVDKTGRVQGLDPTTGICQVLWRMPDRELGKPVGLTVAPGRDEKGQWCEELLYIADTHYNRVMVYRPPAADRQSPAHEPTLVMSFGKYGTGPGEFRYPTDVAVLLAPGGKAVERIYVSEYGGNDRISIFDGEGSFLSSFGTFGAGRAGEAVADAVQFDRPQSLSIETVAGKPELIVVDAHNHRVGRFTLEGELIRWFGSRDHPGDEPGAFRYPYGLASLGDGTVLVCEFGNNRVQRIDLASGEGLGSWGRAGRGEGELAAPWAVGILGRTAYVLDSGNNRVLSFSAPRRK